eukprot:CAMPEP_0119334006 /NCGR_PEP_ID=MMETSP1333-20130426/86478_1 /TAXON_ID=418940 /ORGANISM="Scyphosphaera apsteinii, Strain RCC1455" /LENGTH=232 /DNA_ID=CAMNT_0007344215 /DNA_START=13 /DNA_END=707 /DNA_ORIENTATION=+
MGILPTTAVRYMLLLLGTLAQSNTKCEPYCKHSCSELNGQVSFECGSCSGLAFACRPGAAGFTELNIGLEPKGAADAAAPGVLDLNDRFGQRLCDDFEVQFLLAEPGLLDALPSLISSHPSGSHCLGHAILKAAIRLDPLTCIAVARLTAHDSFNVRIGSAEFLVINGRLGDACTTALTEGLDTHDIAVRWITLHTLERTHKPGDRLVLQLMLQRLHPRALPGTRWMAVKAL